MNKYIYVSAIALLVLAGGILYRLFLIPEASLPCVPTGNVRNITITAKQNEWRFLPEFIEVDCGDKISMTVINEDEYDHGIAIDAFGISQRMPAKATIKIDFNATQGGDFPFYCSVPCGEGEVNGEHRTHFDMIGKMHVRSIISEAQ